MEKGEHILMYVILLSLLGFLISIFVPTGGIIIFSITFAVVILNYQNTLKINKEMKDIRRHFNLLEPHELEEYEIEKQLKEYDELDSVKMEEVNKGIEKDLEKTMDKEKE
jgi:uncharacterized membrane protein (DUF106 family)